MSVVESTGGSLMKLFQRVSGFSLLLAMTLSCSTSRTVGPQCAEMGKTVYASELARKFGEPDKKSQQAPPLQIWTYHGSDGTCLVWVYGDMVHPRTEFMPISDETVTANMPTHLRARKHLCQHRMGRSSENGE
jgi:hypothetical protein